MYSLHLPNRERIPSQLRRPQQNRSNHHIIRPARGLAKPTIGLIGADDEAFARVSLAVETDAGLGVDDGGLDVGVVAVRDQLYFCGGDDALSIFDEGGPDFVPLGGVTDAPVVCVTGKGRPAWLDCKKLFDGRLLTP